MFSLSHGWASVVLAFLTASSANAYKLSVANSGGNTTSPLQYGVIFEDISHSGDGGLYAELIQNRAFQATSFANATTAPWTAVNGAQLAVQSINPLSSAIPFSINVSVPASQRYGYPNVGIANPGWWGIDVQVQQYTGSFWMLGSYDGDIVASLQSEVGQEPFGSVNVPVKSSAHQWTHYEFNLHATKAAPSVNNTFSLTFDPRLAKQGSLAFTIVSLFPPTFMGRSNGMRMELSQDVKNLAPSFLRFPGGNNLEGLGPAQNSPRWTWNNTIGPLKDRPGRFGTWGYYNTDGLGLNEYLQWCSDIGMEPLLAIWDGLYLDGPVLSESELGPYVQDALDELEYLMGSTSSPLGARRAADGYPNPWSIKYVEIGNEDHLAGGLESYNAYRFNAFYEAIHQAYPDITIIASTQEIAVPKGAGVDFHLYTRPDDMVLNYFHYFDNASAEYPTLCGEYSVFQPNVPGGGGADYSLPSLPLPNWVGAIAEATYLIGLERNSHGVIGASYAPVLQNLNDYQWSPDEFSFTADPSQTLVSTSAQLVSLFSKTRMTETLPVRCTQDFGPLYYVTGSNSQTGSHIFKGAVYNATSDVPITLDFAGVPVGTTATLTVLTADSPFASVTSAAENPVQTHVSSLRSGKAGFTFSLPNYSIALLETQAGGSGHYSKREAEAHAVMEVSSRFLTGQRI